MMRTFFLFLNNKKMEPDKISRLFAKNKSFLTNLITFPFNKTAWMEDNGSTKEKIYLDYQYNR